MGSAASRFEHFVQRHRKFLREFPDATPERRKRPLRYIEESGIECALWPHLYWDLGLCETVARLSDVRRKQKPGPGEDSEGSGPEDWEAADGEQQGRHSLKRNYLSKALGPIADYAGDHELVQFVFDLSVWSDIGGKKGALQGIPMWQAMKGAAWTPQFWKVRHAAALDMQAQCGYPAAFVTVAPFEWSAPYSTWLLRQMEQLGRQRLKLAGPEALHLAHLLTELFREWVCGGGRKFGDASTSWREPLVGGTREDGSRVKINFVGRLEFQDGKRKEATQSYHGRGAVHLHGLIFAEELGPLHLEQALSATVPAEGHPLRGYVLDGQAGRTGSGWPRYEGENCFDPINSSVKLQHTPLDKRLGIRGYFPELLDVFKCHQDVQVGAGSGLLLKYAATYLPKFSDGPGKELMDDASSGYGAARRVLFTYHPGEPEMWLLLATQNFPMFFMGGTMMPIIAPHPGMPKKPSYVQHYEAAAGWRAEMTLIEFLRKTNKKGLILEHIRKAHQKAGGDMSLETFALRYETFGEKVVAAEMVTMLNDKPLARFHYSISNLFSGVLGVLCYQVADAVSLGVHPRYFGQWCALHVPFTDLDDLLVPEIVALVPEHMQYLACALHWAPHLWRNEAWVREHMALRAHKAGFVETVLNMIQAHDFFIQQHLDGHLVRAPPAAVAQAAAAPRMLEGYVDRDEDGFNLTPEQKRLEANINQRVDQALKVRMEEDDAELERLGGIIEEHGSMVAALGAPGTGKTAVLDRCIRRAQRLGARVLVALPTGVQRARMRQKHPQVDLDTCHGAFLFHRPLPECMGIMISYDLIVIDEAPQLFEEHFGRLDEMWLAAAKVPCVVLAGDEWQLPPPDHTKRSLVHHRHWRLVFKVELHKVWRQGQGDPLLQKLAYLRKNRPMGAEGERWVRDLCRGHKAWSGHHEPTNLDIEHLFQMTDLSTTVITCTRWGAALVNALAVEVLFELPGLAKLGRVPADYESNANNYEPGGRLKQDVCPEALQLDLYVGLRVRLTRNMAKHLDYVNGMMAKIQSYNSRTGAVVVQTETGQVLCIYPITDDGVPVGRVTYYPLRPGYADTVHKFQGAELKHVTFWPDREGCPAAAYVALSRVRKDADYLLGGCIKVDHFVPAK